MSFEADKKTRNNLADYEQLVQQALAIESQLLAWNGKFSTLRADVDATKQSELDVKKTAFVNKLKTALGL